MGLSKDPIRPVGVFTGAYLAIAAGSAVAKGNFEFLFYIGVLVPLMLGIFYVHRQIRLSVPALWALSLWGLLHMAGGIIPVPENWPISGEIRVLYSWWLIPERLKYDHVIHAYGFGVTTWVCWQGVRSAMERRGAAARPTFGLLVLCVAAGLGFGALNEIVEFVATLTMPETNVGGYINTGWDLVSNAVGAMTAASLIAIFDGKSTDPNSKRQV